jgi:hypothetical protein
MEERDTGEQRERVVKESGEIESGETNNRNLKTPSNLELSE